MKLSDLTESKEPKIEGYWYSPSTPDYPKPIENSLSGNKEEIIKKLELAESIAHVESYRGMSNCRICESRNGCREFELDGWVWPQGLMHYVKDHNVELSEQFKKDILKL